jgi:hypothetical protein
LDNGRETAALLQQQSVDTLHIMNNEDGHVLMDASREHSSISSPHALMELGHHFADIWRNVVWSKCRRKSTMAVALETVIDSHLKCPTIK